MGFFKVDRQLFDHWLWEDKPFSKGQAWIDLVGLANYEDGKVAYKGEVINCKRGTVYRSLSFLASRWGWSRKKVKAFITLLESDKMVTTEVTTHRTTITLINYGKFQDVGTTKGTTNGTTNAQQRNSKGSNEKEEIKKNKETKNNSGAGAPVYGTRKSVMAGMERKTDYDALIPQLVRRRLHHGEAEAETLQQG